MSTEDKKPSSVQNANAQLSMDLLRTLTDTLRRLETSGKAKDATIEAQRDIIAKQRCYYFHQEFQVGYLEEALREEGKIRDIQEDKLDANTEALNDLTKELDNVTEDLQVANFRVDRLTRKLAAGDQKIKELRKLTKSLQAKSQHHQEYVDKKAILVRNLRAEVAYLGRELRKTKSESRLDRVRHDADNRLSDKELYRRLIEYGDTEQAAKLLESARKLDELQALDRIWMYEENDVKVDQKSHNGGGKKGPGPSFDYYSSQTDTNKTSRSDAELHNTCWYQSHSRWETRQSQSIGSIPAKLPTK